MAVGMSDETQSAVPLEAVEQVMVERLRSGDAVLASTRPILRHLLANRDQSLFSDEVIARVRGMICHVARQLLFARAVADDIADPALFAARQQDGLATLLFDDVSFLAHAHALTLEAQLAEAVQRRSSIDSVLSPLLQELTASSDEPTAASAMRVIAAQARFMQAQRRMELPLTELPGDLFHKALLLMRNHADDADCAARAEVGLRAQFDESQGRIGQLTRLVMAMGRKASRALELNHAGLAIFATGLAMASRQDRNLAILSFGEESAGAPCLVAACGGAWAGCGRRAIPLYSSRGATSRGIWPSDAGSRRSNSGGEVTAGGRLSHVRERTLQRYCPYRWARLAD